MQRNWQPKPGDPVVRRPRVQETRPVTIRIPLRTPRLRPINSPMTLIGGLTALIAIGTVLLMLPFASASGEWSSPMSALFTATSAATVTGLVVVDTPTHWSFAGQAIIWLLILVGGLGWMTMAGFIYILLGQRITLPQRMAFREGLGDTRIGGILRAIRNLMVTALALQLVGGLLLTINFAASLGMSLPEAAWHGVFQAVSGFNNAGFTTLPDSQSLSAFREDLVTLGVMAFLIMLGGLSFAVISDLVRVRRFSRFSLDTKIIVVASVALWALGALVVFGFEYDRPETLGAMPLGQKVVHAAFESITARAAGFSTINTGVLNSATIFFIMGLMFIGTASASAGGGIRLNTLGVVVATIVASIRGQDHVTAFGREVSPFQVHRAIAVTILGFLLVFVVAFILTGTESAHEPFINLLFEVFSAVGTVGLSTGITPDLSVVGQLMIIVTMVVGRIGPLALGLALVHHEGRSPLYRYPTERVRIG
ncbi:MAG: Trk family potassium uptake protein [Chloroflexota bacterium]|nr:Trk family potassium uptake protein [Chloroflexota bacterium]